MGRQQSCSEERQDSLVMVYLQAGSKGEYEGVSQCKHCSCEEGKSNKNPISIVFMQSGEAGGLLIPVRDWEPEDTAAVPHECLEVT